MSAARLDNESTQAWLERLIGVGASDSTIAAVTEILKKESQGKPPQNNFHNKLSTCCFPLCKYVCCLVVVHWVCSMVVLLWVFIGGISNLVTKDDIVGIQETLKQLKLKTKKCQ